MTNYKTVGPDQDGRMYKIEATEAQLPVERLVMRLRGQLQNCVNHLEQAKRNSYGKNRQSYEAAIESANKALYETLGA